MRTVEKILIPMMIILGFIMLIFIGLKLFTLDSKVSSISETLSGWDKHLND
jgi:hypothetical protein